MYQRMLEIDSSSQNSIFLFGPRGTGKTHWVKNSFKEYLYIDLLNMEFFTRLSASPTRLEKIIPKNFNHWIIIDEVQKIPDLLNEVHRLIEHKGYKFILTGSSARSLRRQGVNLLAGRALKYAMHPLIYQEVLNDFDMAHALQYGLLPNAVNHKNPQHFLQSYIKTYLHEEILEEAVLRNLGTFNRFLEVASFSQGAVINQSEIAREVCVDRKVINNYFTILEDLLIGVHLPVFTRGAKRRLIAHPKFYFFDVGIYQTIRPKGPLDSIEEMQGPGLETLLLQHLRALNDYLQLGYQIYYWRTSNNVEVDFVLYGERGLHAIEIKRKRTLTKKDFSGLHAFLNDYPVAKATMVYGGDMLEYEKDIAVVPVEKMLAKLPEILA